MPALNIGDKKPSPFWTSLAKDILSPFAPTHTSLIQKILQNDLKPARKDDSKAKSVYFEGDPPIGVSKYKQSPLLKLTKVDSNKASSDQKFKDALLRKKGASNANIYKNDRSLQKSEQFQRKVPNSKRVKNPEVRSQVSNILFDLKFDSVSFLSDSPPAFERFEDEKPKSVVPLIREKSVNQLSKMISVVRTLESQLGPREENFKVRRKSCNCSCCGHSTRLEQRTMNLPLRIKTVKARELLASPAPVHQKVEVSKKNFAPRRSFQNDSLALKICSDWEKKASKPHKTIISPGVHAEPSDKGFPLFRAPSNSAIISPMKSNLNINSENIQKFIHSGNSQELQQSEGMSQRNLIDPLSAPAQFQSTSQHLKSMNSFQDPSLTDKNLTKIGPKGNDDSISVTSESQLSIKGSFRMEAQNKLPALSDSKKKKVASSRTDPKYLGMKKLLGNVRELKNMEKKLRAKMKLFDESLDMRPSSNRTNSFTPPVLLEDKPPSRSIYSTAPFHIEKSSPPYALMFHRKYSHSGSGQGWLSKSSSKQPPYTSLNGTSVNSTHWGNGVTKHYEISRKSSLK